jgi:hypothetical protein
MFKRPVVCGFCIFWETAAGKLPHVHVIGNAFAANTFSGTGVVSTATSFQVFLLITIHFKAPFCWQPAAPQFANDFPAFSILCPYKSLKVSNGVSKCRFIPTGHTIHKKMQLFREFS